jgi:cell division protein FtsI/penicillin-binding protein 2
MAIAALANKGVLMQPMLVDRLEDEKGQVVVQYHPQGLRRVVIESAAKQTVQALKSVVEKGTGDKAALKLHRRRKDRNSRKARPGGYAKDKYYGSFIGFFPRRSRLGASPFL